MDRPNCSKAFLDEPRRKGSFKKKQHDARTRGKQYLTGKKKEIPAKNPVFSQDICRCRYQCRELEDDYKMELFENFHKQDENTQGTYLLGLLEVIPVQRRRHGSYESPSESRRQSTVTFFIPDGKGEHSRVCKKTFMSVFGIKSSKRIEILVKRKKLGITMYKDERGGLRNFKFTVADRNIVKNHIKSIPTEPSHYNRTRSETEYLSQDLNLNRLYRAFKILYPESQVNYKFYRKVFLTDFPNLKFRKPRVDTCKTCDRLKNEKKSNDSLIAKTACIDLEKHHRKAEAAFKCIRNDSISSTLPDSDTCTIVIDLQKVFALPKLTHSNMYYARQLSCYNFGIHVCDTGEGIMCVWHEGQSGRGGNQMASCLLRAVNNLNLTNKRKLVIWSDNCCGQIKNKMMVFLYIYLVTIGLFDEIDHKFLVVGHSFSAADRDFALIEKRWKVSKAQVIADVKRVITTARPSKPFRILDMTGKFLDFEEASSSVINTTKMQISKTSWLRIHAKCPGEVKTKTTFNDLEDWKICKVFNPTVNLNTIKSTLLQSLPATIPLPKAKKEDIKKMLPYIAEENKPFFEDLCAN